MFKKYSCFNWTPYLTFSTKSCNDIVQTNWLQQKWMEHLQQTIQFQSASSKKLLQLVYKDKKIQSPMNDCLLSPRRYDQFWLFVWYQGMDIENWDFYLRIPMTDNQNLCCTKLSWLSIRLTQRKTRMYPPANLSASWN